MRALFFLPLALICLAIRSVAAPPEAPPAAQREVAFRLIFKGYNGEPANPGTLDFQVDTLDVRQPSAFLKIGEIIPLTKLKLTKFELKVAKNPTTGEPRDVSELTVTNVTTGETSILVLAKVAKIPAAAR